METMTFDEYLANPGDPELAELFAEADRIARRCELTDERLQIKLQLINLSSRLREINAELKELS